MKVLMLVLPDRIARYSDPKDIPADWEYVYMAPDAEDDALLAAAGDADFIFADAVRPVSGYLIRHMPNLKMVHSEGVGYNSIDVAAAKECGVAVCNCPGCNAVAVAEQAVLLILGVMRKAVDAHNAVLRAEQGQYKHNFGQAGISQLSEKSVGFLGFGAIARQTAKRLAAFGCTLYCCNRSPVSEECQREYGVTCLSQEELLATCDIISIHVPVTPQTTGMINKETIAKMKPGVILINTARGDIVCQEDLAAALVSGHVGGIGLDVYTPEPVTPDNPLLHLPRSCMDRVFFSPHIGGISTRSFLDAQKHVWTNFKTVAAGGAPLTPVK